MTLAPDTEDRIARHWAERLDCSPEAFSAAGVTVVDTATEGTIRLFRRGDALVVAAPGEFHDALGDAAVELDAADLA
ncbi:hypothetical protein ACFQEQ_09830, partial [Halolamina salina]|uniref:hypothetical protein n=1 Tax=Halolamina salina TaxID=1220023 RepID=UPI00361CE770